MITKKAVIHAKICCVELFFKRSSTVHDEDELRLKLWDIRENTQQKHVCRLHRWKSMTPIRISSFILRVSRLIGWLCGQTKSFSFIISVKLPQKFFNGIGTTCRINFSRLKRNNDVLNTLKNQDIQKGGVWERHLEVNDNCQTVETSLWPSQTNFLAVAVHISTEKNIRLK